MKLIELIKRDKADLEKHRGIVKIHLSWDAKKKLLTDPSLADYDETSSNLNDTLLGCALLHGYNSTS
jgi:hypothetical protein